MVLSTKIDIITTDYPFQWDRRQKSDAVEV